VCRFLDHWQPELAIWVESELWPNLLRDTQLRQIPTVLVQGRMSAKSYRYWRWARGLIAPLLAGFDQVLVQTQADANRFRDLGAVQPMVTGTLKYAAPALAAEETTLRELGNALGARTRWLAASVHPGEFEIVYQTHLVLRSRFPDLLTIVVPRHPSSASYLEKEWVSKGLSCARRGVGMELSPETEIYIADTMGELGLFYRISPLALIGGSFIDHGGQNPIEAIQLDCAVLTGPSMFNFSEVMGDLGQIGAACRVETAGGLSEAVSGLLAAPERAAHLSKQQKKVITAKAVVIDTVFEILVHHLPTAG
jgi:3-deoxy-D-manno-octulosonic-acid transferase